MWCNMQRLADDCALDFVRTDKLLHVLPRRAISVVGLAVFLVLGSAGTSFAQGTPADLTAVPTAVTVTILAQHQSQPISVAVTASQAIPATDTLGASVLGDLVRDDSAARIPRSAVQVSIARDANDPTNKTFWLTLTPNLSGIDPGKYTGNVQVTGPDVNPLIVPVTMIIQGGSWLGALALLLLGLLLGWALKWYADSGSKLAAETRRYNRILGRIGDTATANMPRFVLDELDDVTQGFNDVDQAKVDAALTLLEGQIGGLAAVTDVVGHLRDSILAHDSEIQQQGLGFGQIKTNERRQLNDALNEATDLSTAKQSVSELLVHATAITICLQNAADAGYNNVLTLYDQDRFDDALNEFQKLPAPPQQAASVAAVGTRPRVGGAIDPARLQSLLNAGAHLQAALAAPVGGPPPAGPGLAAPATNRRTNPAAAMRAFLRWLPLIMGVVTVLVLALIGLKTQWASNLTFGSGGVWDYVALFVWGVAAFVTGKTLSDFLSRVVSQAGSN
jgi:hypothetical protein